MTKIKIYTEEQVRKAIELSRDTHQEGKPYHEREEYDYSIDEVIYLLTPIEILSDDEIIPVKALEEDGDWYLIPNELYEEFKNDTYNEEMVESGGFDDKWWTYKTGGDLNLIQLYVKIKRR